MKIFGAFALLVFGITTVFNAQAKKRNMTNVDCANKGKRNIRFIKRSSLSQNMNARHLLKYEGNFDAN